MGRPRRRGRDVHGIVLLDKPQGWSSNDVLQRVKRLFQANKAGHTGALDPLATGMLPICLGEATKFSQYLLDADKRYRVIARLGQRTTTSDADGEIVAERPVAVSESALQQALTQFRGEIKQIPSMYSALKHQGRPLYEYARQGITIERAARPITIYELNLCRFADDEVELEVHCSKGTYIRTLVDDLGEVLGCGAHVTFLRRLNVADYPPERMVTLEQLHHYSQQAEQAQRPLSETLDTLLLPADSAVCALPEVWLSAALAERIRYGQRVTLEAPVQHGLVRLTTGDERAFIGVGEWDDAGRLVPRRLLAETAPLGA